jgi:hypothetical protein
MHLANGNAAPYENAPAARAAELRDLRKRLLEMIHHNEVARRSAQRMDAQRMGLGPPQRGLPT